MHRALNFFEKTAVLVIVELESDFDAVVLLSLSWSVTVIICAALYIWNPTDRTNVKISTGAE